MVSVVQIKGRKNLVIRWTDNSGRRCEVSTGTSDHKVAELIRAEKEKQLALVKAGIVDPADIHRSEQGRRPLLEHVAEFERHMIAKGRDAEHVKGTLRIVRSVLADLRATRLADIQGDPMLRLLAQMREADYAPRTIQSYLVAMKSFVRWLLRSGRIGTDPLAYLSAPAGDARLKRRALTLDEQRRLVAAAESSDKVVRGLSGPDRGMLYRIALGTGFRVSEIAALRRANVRLDGEYPKIVLAAADTKNRHEAEQMIRPSLAARLRPWLALRLPDSPLFAVKELKFRAAKMLKHDLDVAGIPYIEDDRVADFHALRHTFNMELRRGRMDPGLSQRLMRHATATLALERYTHLSDSEVANALAALPDLDTPDQGAEAMRATGTTGSHQKRHLSDANRSGSLPVADGRSDGASEPNAGTTDAPFGDSRGRSGWCEEGDSNPHGCNPPDPKSVNVEQNASSVITSGEASAPATKNADPLLPAARALVAAYERLKAAASDPDAFLHPAAIRVRATLGPELDALAAALRGRA